MRLEKAIPAAALEAIRAPFLNAGAQTADSPVLQPLSLLLDLSGESMRARLFVVQGDGGEELALRPDFTIGVARSHIEAGTAIGRYVYEGKAFRVAPAGSDRAEEFLQIGIEAFGPPEGPRADAEVAALAWKASAAGGRDDLTLLLGDVSLFSAFVDSLDLAAPLAARLKRAFSHPRLLKAELDAEPVAATPSGSGKLANLLAGLPEAEAEEVLRELWAMTGVEPVGGRRPADIVHRLIVRAEAQDAGRLSADEIAAVRGYLAVSASPRAALSTVKTLAGPKAAALDAALKDWDVRLSALAELGADESRMTLSTGFGRAFGYYDGMLFEVRSAALGDERPVAAGGRYDGLLPRLGGKAAGAVGCMVRPARAYAGGVE
ncbi:ATP phosphoribosyltransferase regulatory subunit [Caulobacter segnis]|uniref:ATP phosphoribosyltransferase regulatory subunit n=1 Tax=Caulobacter segnis TaxID=88688 RepID=UPI00241072E3|nr:ATP phosphoribosyltransferase regulatory subunit [Caulobacter segnis]MDG2520799.1 ATP phosphoribosyltransferase regulatory subunit [Caulobacter segnis]